VGGGAGGRGGESCRPGGISRRAAVEWIVSCIGTSAVHTNIVLRSEDFRGTKEGEEGGRKEGMY